LPRQSPNCFSGRAHAHEGQPQLHQRIDYGDGAIVEMVLWRVPSPVPPSVHGLKYSLFYGRPRIREVGYDNERGKGDHWHFQGAETAYACAGVEQLMADFRSDMRTLGGDG
jgi:hypothetical protein